MRRFRRYEDFLTKRLKDPRAALGYLNTALEEGDESVFLLALKDVVRAQGGISLLARRSKLHRVNLHRILSREGNPEMKSLSNLLDALGLHLAVVAKHPPEFLRAA